MALTVSSPNLIYSSVFSRAVSFISSVYLILCSLEIDDIENTNWHDSYVSKYVCKNNAINIEVFLPYPPRFSFLCSSLNNTMYVGLSATKIGLSFLDSG